MPPGNAPAVLSRYLLRRVTRIEPPSVVILTLLFAGTLVTGVGPGLGHYVAGLAYVHQLWFGSANPLDSVTWSLEVEIQFYLLVPLLAIAAQGAGAFAGTNLVATLTNNLQFFMVGWLLGDVYVSDWGSGTRIPEHRWWDVVTIVGWPALFAGLLTGGAFLVLVAPWLILALGAAAFCGPLTRRALSRPWIATIGGMCYSIYLTHYPIMIVLRHQVAGFAGLPYPLALSIAIALLVPVTILAGALFYVFVERPCMDPGWPRRVARVMARGGIPGGPRITPRSVEGSAPMLVDPDG